MEEKPRLSDRIRRTARFKHLSLRTENSYLNWIRRFYLFCNRRDRARLGKEEIRNFLSHLATDKHVSASTQNQAFSAILFLYRDVLQIELPQIEHVERPRIKKRIPVIFTRSQAKAVLSEMNGIHKLRASLLYGSGLRLMECVRLRVKDLDLHRTQIVGARYKRAKCANYLASTLIKTTPRRTPQACSIPAYRRSRARIRRGLSSGCPRTKIPECP